MPSPGCSPGIAATGRTVGVPWSRSPGGPRLVYLAEVLELRGATVLVRLILPDELLEVPVAELVPVVEPRRRPPATGPLSPAARRQVEAWVASVMTGPVVGPVGRR